MDGLVNFVWIDMPNDFCDVDGTMYVEGANHDVIVASQVINKASVLHLAGKLRCTHMASLDQHHQMHIAHACMWINDHGVNPPPGKPITREDVSRGVWKAKFPYMQNHYVSYVNALAALHKPDLMIWPDHCRIGTWGANIHPAVGESLNNAEAATGVPTLWKFKGMNLFTEMYSFVEAEVPDPNDATTLMDETLIRSLAANRWNVFGGEALDYCYKGSILDTAEAAQTLGIMSADDFLRKSILLRDATSAIGFPVGLAEQFVEDMKNRGMVVTTSDQLFDVLLAS